MLRCLSAEIWAVMTQNWENWEITQNSWLDPLYHYMNDMMSICLKISLFVKYVQNHIGNELNTSKQRWIKSSCVLCKLAQLVPIFWHTKLFGQCYNKNLLIFCLFWGFFNFCRLAASFVLDFFSKNSKLGDTFTKYRKFALGNPVICIWG